MQWTASFKRQKQPYFKFTVEIKCLFLIIVGLITLLLGGVRPTYAEVKQVNLTTLETEQDLAVLFQYETEIVDIQFISPSGQVYTNDSAELAYEEGDLWRTYRLTNAEPGVWQIEVDKGTNDHIQYSIIDDRAGLWVDYFNVESRLNQPIKVEFKADYDGGDKRYHYEISAVNEWDLSQSTVLSTGRADSGEAVEEEIDIDQLATGRYTFHLQVYYDEDGAEVFDSAVSDPIEHTNPNMLEAIEDYTVNIDKDDLYCEVNWEDYRDYWSQDGYKVCAKADGEVVYDEVLPSKTEGVVFYFIEGSSRLDIEVSYSHKGVWSKVLKKTIHLDDSEYLTIKTPKVTRHFYAEIAYKTANENTIEVTVGDEESKTFSIKGENLVYAQLEKGKNQVHAEFTGEDGTLLSVDQTIYVDTIGPEINVSDDPNRKTVRTDTLTLKGSIVGGSQLRVNDEPIDLNEDLTFTKTVKLKMGENKFNLYATDVNGNVTLRGITVYREARFIPVSFKDKIEVFVLHHFEGVFSLIVSIPLVLGAINLLRTTKSKSKEKKKPIHNFIIAGIVSAFIEITIVHEYYERYMITHSQKFMDILQASLNGGIRYMNKQAILGMASVIGGVICLILLATILMLHKKEKLNQDRMNGTYEG